MSVHTLGTATHDDVDAQLAADLEELALWTTSGVARRGTIGVMAPECAWLRRTEWYCLHLLRTCFLFQPLSWVMRRMIRTWLVRR